MKHMLLSVFIPLIHFSIHTMNETISKDAFHPNTLVMFNVTINALHLSVKDTQSGLPAIIGDVHKTKARGLLDNPKVIAQANVILQSLRAQEFAVKQSENKKNAQHQVLSLATLIPLLKTNKKDVLKIYDNRVAKVTISAGQAYNDIAYLMPLNTELDVEKCSIDFKAFMITYFYLTQQNPAIH